MKLMKFSRGQNKLTTVCALFTAISLSIASCTKDSPVALEAMKSPDKPTIDKAAVVDTDSGTITNANLTTNATTLTSVIDVTNLIYKKSAPINYNGVNNITISGLTITAGSGPAISLSNCNNVRITLSRFVDGTNVNAVGVYLYKCTNVTIDYCYFNKVASGVYASTSTGVNVSNNQMVNMQGPMPRGQFVQFNACYGEGNKIINNKLENIMGQSVPEDAINIYKSNGTAASPITIRGNWIRGGGPSTTGGGIALGDDGGSYQVASNNILVNPGQYGIAIASGNTMSIVNNKIFAAKAPFTNVGTFAWNQYESTSGCSLVTISGNQVNFMAAGGYQNSSWNGGNCGTINGWETNKWGAKSLTAAILPFLLITMK